MNERTETLAAATHWGRDVLTTLYRRYGHELVELDAVIAKVGDIGKSYASEESRVLYLMTRHIAPDVVFEFSPKRGWTTVHIAAALERNGKGRILSFELEPAYAWVARRTLRRAGLGHRARFFIGDVREQLPGVYERLRATGEIQGIQFLFIDSDHSGDFARWYLDNLFPLVQPNGVIHVHGSVRDRPCASGFVSPCADAPRWVPPSSCPEPRGLPAPQLPLAGYGPAPGRSGGARTRGDQPRVRRGMRRAGGSSTAV
jgi:predicted O-methyltransferase YrrM